MATTHREIERKYEAPEGADVDLGSLQGLAPSGEAQVQDLDATYFDTPEKDLGRANVVMRRRRGGHDEGWHIKFSLGDARHELHFPLLKDGTSMPAAVRTALAAVARGKDLEPVVHLGTQRVRTLLADADGREVAELCDDTVSSLDFATGIERSWREWEVELGELELSAEEQERIFEQVEHAVFAAGAQPSTAVAKSARALGRDKAFDEAHGIVEGKKSSAKSGKKKSAGKKSSKNTQGKNKDKGSTGNGKKTEAAERLVSDVVRRFVRDLGPWDLAVRAGLPGAEAQLRRRLAGLRHLLRGAEEGLSVRSGSVADVAALAEELDAVLPRLDAVIELDAVLRHLHADSAWETLTRTARDEVEALHAEDRETARRGLLARLDGSEYVRSMQTLASLADEPQAVAWAQGISARKLAKKVLRALEDELVEARGALGESEDSGAAAEAELLALAADAALGVRRVGRAFLLTADLGSKQEDRTKSARRSSRRVRNAAEEAWGLAATSAWLERAARVFQRRGLDRFAVGVLLGRAEVRRGAVDEHVEEILLQG